MKRILFVCTFLAAVSAHAAPKDKSAPPPRGSEPTSAPSSSTDDATLSSPSSPRVDREALKQELLRELKPEIEKRATELRDELREQVAAQNAVPFMEDTPGFGSDSAGKKLNLFELDGYFRLRPSLAYNYGLGRGVDPNGYALYPGTKTTAGADMRLRLDPTLNVSEEIRLRGQLDLFDNLMLGSTPGLSDRDPTAISSQNQATPSDLSKSIALKRVWGEVETPIGLFSFGRMGSDWGLGMLTNSGSCSKAKPATAWGPNMLGNGNCIDSDFGDTVDRIMFVNEKHPVLGSIYIIPMLSFVSEGPTALNGVNFGHPYDLNQRDDARDYALIITKRDDPLTIKRKLGADQDIINYGLYLDYRTQGWDSATTADGKFDPTGTPVARNASLFVPDAWVKYQNRKLRLELEAAGVFGTIGDASLVGGGTPQKVSVRQFGLVAQGQYSVLSSLDVGAELGFASGDKAPGMGNLPGRGTTVPGSIDGAQYGGGDNKVTNFRFNRAYDVDMILWRELLQGVTDAVYTKGGFQWEMGGGLALWSNFIYSRAVESTSVPAAHVDPGTGKVVGGNPNLGFEVDSGLRYLSGDNSFMGTLSYGALFSLGGLDNYDNGLVKHPGNAQSLRATFAILF